MIYVVELFYLITIAIGISAFSVHMTARGKNLAVTNRLAKNGTTTLCLLLVIIFNICDFLILFLAGWLGLSAVNMILIIENILEVALAYALIEMEREYFMLKESRSCFTFFVITAAAILWGDTAYTAGILAISEKSYLISMLGMNLLPVGALLVFSIRNFRIITRTESGGVPSRYFLLYNVVLLFFCVVATLSIIDSRTRTDFIGGDKEIYVVFWFLFNIMNFIMIWRSCRCAENTADPEEKETPDEAISRVGNHFGLSERELEIARLICTGKNNNDIAGELFLSPNTVKVHTSNLYKKLGVKNRVQAVQVLHGEKIKNVQ